MKNSNRRIGICVCVDFEGRVESSELFTSSSLELAGTLVVATSLKVG